MKKLVLIIIMAIVTSGCATLSKPGAPFYEMGQKKKLSGAMTLLQQGKTTDAADHLAVIVKDPPVPGVTDQALFLLSVLRLGPGGEKNGTASGKSDLDRLVKEYPASPWAPLASTLSDFITTTGNRLHDDSKLKELILAQSRENKELKERNIALSKEQRTLKDSNLSLLKENAELRANLEKLKTIDLDLERRPKRR